MSQAIQQRRLEFFALPRGLRTGHDLTAAGIFQTDRDQVQQGVTSGV